MIKRRASRADTAPVERRAFTRRGAAEAAAATAARRAAVQRGMVTMAVFVLLMAGLTLGLDLWAFLVLQMALGLALWFGDSLARARRRRADDAAGAGVEGVLGSLRERGWKTVDGVALRRGVVDHVLIGPLGVFVLEVTAHGDVADAERLDELAARRVVHHARTIGELAGHPVVPVLVLDGAPGGAPILDDHGVVVVPARGLFALMRGRRRVLSIDETAELSARLRAVLEAPAPTARHA